MIASQTPLKDRLETLRGAGHASEDLPTRLRALETELQVAIRLREWERAHRLREEAQSVRERIFEALRPNTIREEARVVPTPERVRAKWRERYFRNVEREVSG